ncbi:TetR/AcrR family transcriptional regulator [Kitasatospora sp. NPDC008050]|uniref:TetR/AcrR family transcriptional regulator n=1 Tax=Kitasatospora sp. NPDC008050 TaxID=3364021 RepID=UPI0036E8A4EB
MSTGRTEDVIWLRPEQASVGRPAERSRAEITAAAVDLADREGLDAVSMRRLAGELGTGAASLYRYLATRDDLLDLMTDATAAEYALAPPSGDWLADLVEVGRQARAIMRRHPWLPALVAARPTLGPNGAGLLEHVLAVLADHPAAAATKLEAFAMLNAVATALMQHELGGGEAAQQRQAAYLWHLAQQGEHPHLAELVGRLAPAAGPTDRADDILARVLRGILEAGPAH